MEIVASPFENFSLRHCLWLKSYAARLLIGK